MTGQFSRQQAIMKPWLMRTCLGSHSTDHNLKSFLGNTIAEFKTALKQDVSISARSDVDSDKMAQKTRIRKCLWLATMITNKNVKQRVLGMTSMAQKVRSIQLRQTWSLSIIIFSTRCPSQKQVVISLWRHRILFDWEMGKQRERFIQRIFWLKFITAEDRTADRVSSVMMRQWPLSKCPKNVDPYYSWYMPEIPRGFALRKIYEDMFIFNPATKEFQKEQKHDWSLSSSRAFMGTMLLWQM